MKINATDEIWGDAVRIIIESKSYKTEDSDNGVVITKYICKEYNEYMTFDDALQIAKENGFIDGTFLMIVENPLRGIIYQYANCYDGEPYWSEYGTTIGYA